MEPISIQTSLENEQVILLPLKEGDFEALYAAAADPEIWAQHPNKDRWQKEVFKVFLKVQCRAGALLRSSINCPSRL